MGIAANLDGRATTVPTRATVAVAVVAIHVGVTVAAYAAQGAFYRRLGAPVGLGVSVFAVAAQPATIAVTAAIVGVAYLLGSVLRRVDAAALSGVLAVFAVVAVAVVASVFHVAVERQAARAAAGHPLGSSVLSLLSPYQLTAQNVTVTPIDAAGSDGSVGGVLYLGELRGVDVIYRPADRTIELDPADNVVITTILG